MAASPSPSDDASCSIPHAVSHRPLSISSSRCYAGYSLDALFSLCSLSWILCQYAVAAVARFVSSSSSSLCHSIIPLSLVLIVGETPLYLRLPLTPSLYLPSLACVDCWVNIVLFLSLSLSLDVPSLFIWRPADPLLLQRFYHQCHVMPTLCRIKLFRCQIFLVKSCRRHRQRVW
jgi:hypothetical protein